MYADRYASGPRFNPASLGIAIAVNAAFVAALIFSSPVIDIINREKRITIYPVDPVEPPPPEPQPKPLDRRPSRPTETIHAPIPPIPVPTSENPIPTTSDPTPPVPIPGPDTGPAADPAPPPPLPFVEPAIDPRYADDFQPVYPADERRAGRDGRVKLRVLVGIDGRVKQVERIDATSDAFAKAATDRARAKWRFRPATRGGVPVEAWRVMTLTFVLKD